jgi:adenylyl cyclase-associated protein
LEDLATAVPPNGAASAVVPPPAAAVPAISTPAAAAGPAPPAPPPETLPESVEEFDEIIDNQVAKYIKLSHELGGLIEEQVSSGKAGLERGGKVQQLILLPRVKRSRNALPSNASS